MSDVKMRSRGGARWLTLGEAAGFLGVDATTLRGWADAGKVRTFRTPGGHRRFDALDLEDLVGSAVDASLRTSPLREATAGAGRPSEWLGAQAWYAAVPEASRARMRGYCAELMQVVASYLAGRSPRPAHLATARRIGAAIGREVAAWGITPAQSTEIFLHFKMRVTEALAASRPRGPWRLRSMRDADAFLGNVLQAIMEAYVEAQASTTSVRRKGEG